MSYARITPIVAAAALLFIFACDNTPEPLSPNDRLSFAKGGNPDNQKADGHALVGSPDFFYDYTFTARAHKGEFSGQINGTIHTVQGDFFFEGDVTCLSVDAETNHARITAHITDSDFPLLEGQNVVWTVTDNGQGANEPPDAASMVFVELHPAEMRCALFTTVEEPGEDTEVKVIA